jgi:hypothetical protein
MAVLVAGRKSSITMPAKSGPTQCVAGRLRCVGPGARRMRTLVLPGLVLANRGPRGGDTASRRSARSDSAGRRSGPLSYPAKFDASGVPDGAGATALPWLVEGAP